MTRKISFYAFFFGFSVVLAAVAVEISVYLLIKAGWNPIDAPPYDWRDLGDPLAGTHYRDMNPYFCTWHKTNWEYLHIKSGLRVNYHFNNIGARDTEFNQTCNRPRAIMLGDSFVEGWLLKSENRLSNLLGEWAGIEVLNFGAAGHFGPLQYFLMYKHLASSYDHSFVIVGLVPYNDFQDNDLSFGLVKHRTRFRPYLEGRYPDYQALYFNTDFFYYEGKKYPWRHILESFVINFSMLYRTALNRFPRFFNLPAANSSYSGFYDFSQEDWEKMSYSLERLIDVAHEKGSKVIVFTIPVWWDVLRYFREGPPPLSAMMNSLAANLNFTFVDLLESFAQTCLGTDPKSEPPYWIKYDLHWSEEGNQLALELLKPYLRELGLPPKR